MEKEEKIKVLNEAGFRDQRMVGPSKSGYHREYPDHVVAFNADIYSMTTGERLIYHCDVDVTADFKALHRAAQDIRDDLAICYESGRMLTIIFGALTGYDEVVPWGGKTKC